jgi:hypothetical protein
MGGGVACLLVALSRDTTTGTEARVDYECFTRR